MVTDALSDLVTQVRNAYAAELKSVDMPWSRVRQALADTLASAGYLESVARQENRLVITLKYQGKNPALTGIRRVSKPGARIYMSLKKLPRVLGGLGVNILSTPRGIISDKQAKKLHVGGEIICQVW